ncbi:methionine biosynthesis protein MetW [Sulfuritortus calidifontis]|uniref:Methionine biosynthesis protein MetW n=1 Tax=Sulfuritortus calidifontis TaxID=1914471 RepID=A0A4R3JUY9_9PROT|nr:methionine biosynthesis protein MetW [Sulfuritortus calidifontis]TCS70403.1 methionine biosynthesis protein MetW [Sulfuritortus calidifontis]
MTGNGMLRPDYALIGQWVKPGSRVLDLGCGDGELLRELMDSRQVTGYGVEIDDASILACVKKGVNVIQGDLEQGLSGFENDSFDYVILSRTLQTMRHTEGILKEMLRVGRQGIVTFPNFGYWKNRVQVWQGRMPRSADMPYQWYDTPNIHLCTVRDFEDLCAQHDLNILERVVLTHGRPVTLLPNLLGSLAVFRFEHRR